MAVDNNFTYGLEMELHLRPELVLMDDEATRAGAPSRFNAHHKKSVAVALNLEENGK
jgi:hypothetical protein